MKTELVTAAATLPVALADFKEHIWTQYDETSDDLLTAFLTSATATVENLTGRKLVSQSWRLYLDNWPNGDPDNRIHVPFGRCSAITSVKWTDDDGSETTLVSGTDYLSSLVGVDPYIEGLDGSWPTGALYQVNPIAVVFVTGFGAAAAVPADLLMGVKMLAAHWYEHREAVVVGTIAKEIPLAVEFLLNPWRIKNG